MGARVLIIGIWYKASNWPMERRRVRRLCNQCQAIVEKTPAAQIEGYSEATLDGVAKALNRFESYTRFRDFKLFHIEQAKGFKAHLSEQQSLRSKDRLSKATLYATLSALKRFFLWLAGRPGYKSRISYSDAEYFNLSAKETRIAKAHRDARVPTLEQIRHVIQTMPASTDIERRVEPSSPSRS